MTLLPVYHIESKSLSVRLIMLLISILSFGWVHGQSYIDSLESKLPEAQGAQRWQVSYLLFSELVDEDYKKALFYAEMHFEEALRLADSIKIVKSANARGHVFFKLGKFKNAEKDFKLGLQVANIQGNKDSPDKLEYRKQKKFILNNLALIYTENGQYFESLEAHFESLKLREEDKDTAAIAISLNNIGIAYRFLGDYENARSYYRQSYDLQVKAKVSRELELRLINLADVSNDLAQYDATKQYIKQVLEQCKNKCEPRLFAMSYHTYGVASMKTGDYEQAEANLMKALNIWQDELNTWEEIKELTAIAELKYFQGNYRKALEFLEDSESLGRETGLFEYQLANFKLYAQIYQKLGDYRLASEYQDKYIEIYKSIYSTDLIRNVARLQTKYQEEENLATIERQGNELVITKYKLEAQRNQAIFFTIVTLIIGVLVFFLWRFSLIQQKLNQQLRTAKATIEKQNNALTEINRTLDQRILEKTDELVMANISLQRSNDELDNFIYKTSHDIRGPLASLKGIASLALIESKDEEVTKYIRMLDQTAEGLIRILTRLVSISQITHAKLQPASIDFRSLLSEVITIQNKRGMSQKIKIDHQIQIGVQLNSDRTLMSIILENLIDNAVKFQNTSGRVEPFVRVEVEQKQDQVRISVVDNGIGVDKSSADRIFQMFVRGSEKSGTGGLGLYLSRLAVEKLGGQISLHTTEEKWTEFRVEIPLDLNQVLEARRQQEIQREMEKMMIASKKGNAAPES
ncbi:MAG: tetratricopeptide repeat protein [Cyclobacteriaceae bacterium]